MFKDLAQLIHEYGLRYKKDDLVEALEESMGVSDYESILAAFPKKFQKDWKDLVREVHETHKIYPTELRIIMDNVMKTNWSPRSDKEEVARSLLFILKNMLTSGAINVDAVIKDLAGTGNFPKGAEWVIRYIDRRGWWSSQIVFEVQASENEYGRRWDFIDRRLPFRVQELEHVPRQNIPQTDNPGLRRDGSLPQGARLLGF